jgi:type IV pilus assembly protein PilV
MSRAHGFTLIEVMIAVFILGIGLLGVAGLQSVSSSMNQQSYMRSQATLLADDIADRMRANPLGVDNGDYDMGAAATPTLDTNCNTTSGCGTTAMAQHDLQQWVDTVDEKLPAPPAADTPADRAVVCIDGPPRDDGDPASPDCDGTGNTYVIKIWWLDKAGDTSAGGPHGDTERFVTELRP